MQSILPDLHSEDGKFYPSLLVQLVQVAQLLHHRQSQNNKNQIETLLVQVPELIPLILDTAQPRPLL